MTMHITLPTRPPLRTSLLLLAAGALTSGRAQAEDPLAGAKQVEIDTESAPVTIDDAHPENNVPGPELAMKQPLQMGYLVMQFIQRGREATDQGDYPRAVRYYRALVKAIPERAPAYSMLCGAYEGLGDLGSALDACRAALGKPGVTLDDNVHFVQLLLRKETALEPKDVEDIDAVLGHISKELSSDQTAAITVAELQCSLATRQEDAARLESCSSRLNELAPKDPRSVTYSFARELQKKDIAAAQAVITRGQRLGMPAEATDRMQASLDRARASESPLQSWLKRWGLVGGLTVLVSGGLLGLGVSRRKRPLAGATPRPA